MLITQILIMEMALKVLVIKEEYQSKNLLNNEASMMALRRIINIFSPDYQGKIIKMINLCL